MDIDKKECCSGDIVKAVWSNDIDDQIHGFAKVVFRSGCFMLEWLDDREANAELLAFHYKTGRPRLFKILGNEFENPELLHKFSTKLNTENK